MKWLVPGIIFVAVTAIVAAGTLFLLGSDSETVVTADLNKTDVANDSTAAKQHHTKDKSDKTDDEASLLGKISENLAVLDYEPGLDEMKTKDGLMTIQDSINAVEWLKKEKTRLTKWEKELTGRQKELKVQEYKVQQQIVRLEQAETARVTQLAKLYDGMEAQAVAQLMANLDNYTIVSVLPRMKSKHAAAVMSLLPPARAAKLSKQMITLAEN